MRASPPPAASSFNGLLLAALPGLRLRAMALTHHRSNADDLVQAAVTSALAARHSFTMGTNFRAWMLRILRNHFITTLRRRRETVELDDAPPALLARSGGQEGGIAFAELHKCLGRLPPEQRLVLLLIAVEGLSYEAASEQLGVAVGTLKSRVFRARTQLRLWLMPEEATLPTHRPASLGRQQAALAH